MLIFKTSLELQSYLAEINKGTIGFVPSMGALHEGHLSLIRYSKEKTTTTIASIFVNPKQFNDSKDYEKYPRTIESDVKLLESANCDILFLPNLEEMYQNKQLNVDSFDLGYLDTILEGALRPGHYQGVVTIVEKLFKAVKPDFVFMGLKDYQQVKVIEKLVRDRNLKIEVIGCPTLREKNGLAMSSRNVRLSESGKENAGAIYQLLNFIKEHKGVENPKDILKTANENFIQNSKIKLEYIELRSKIDLTEVEMNHWEKHDYVILFAGWLEGVRLIDNLEF